LSTSFICAGSVTTCAADATILASKTAKTAAADAIASIQVTVRDSAGTSKASSQTITATVTGPGTIGIGTNAVAASAGRALTGTAGQNLITVFGDGTEGKATITISSGTTVLATETISFYGAVAKVVATQNLSNPLANGYLLGSAHATSGTTMLAAGSWANASGNLPAVVLTLTDASGNLIPTQAANISATSSDATVMSATITAVEDTTAAVGAGYYNVSVSSAAGSAAGKSATLTFRVLLTGTTYVSAPATTFTIGSSKISKVAITVDKTSYTAGDPAVMTVTATDAAGLAVADGLYASSTKTAPLFSKSVVNISTMPTTSTLTTVAGKKTYKFYAPSVPGSFTVTGEYYDNDAAVVSTTATSSVTDANAGLLTQIDALNAKIVALNALIAKIMKKLGVK
jgi:adhesin/invasin